MNRDSAGVTLSRLGAFAVGIMWVKRHMSAYLRVTRAASAFSGSKKTSKQTRERQNAAEIGASALITG